MTKTAIDCNGSKQEAVLPRQGIGIVSSDRQLRSGRVAWRVARWAAFFSSSKIGTTNFVPVLILEFQHIPAHLVAVRYAAYSSAYEVVLLD